MKNKLNILLQLISILIMNVCIASDNSDRLTESDGNINHSQSIGLPNEAKQIKTGANEKRGIVLGSTSIHSFAPHDFDSVILMGSRDYSNVYPRDFAWNADKSELFGITNSANVGGKDFLMKIDPITGGASQGPQITGHASGTYLKTFTIDENNTCYIVSVSGNQELSFMYECNLSTGKLTFLGSQGQVDSIQDIEASCDGNIYAMDYPTQNLYKFDKTTWQPILVAELNLENGYGFSKSLTYDRKTRTLYQFISNANGNQTALAKINTDTGETTIVSDGFVSGSYYKAVIKSSCADEYEENPFYITERLNGAWYNSETGGQGFLFDILPKSNTFFAAWFTYEEFIADTVLKSIGATEHRWLTAQGTLGEGDVVELIIYSTQGGEFNQSGDVESNAVGQMTINFDDCSNATVEFNFTESGVSDSIAIKRIASDNVEWCENL